MKRTFEIQLPPGISYEEVKATIADLRCVGVLQQTTERIPGGLLIVDAEEWRNSMESVGGIGNAKNDVEAFQSELQGQFLSPDADQIKVIELYECPKCHKKFPFSELAESDVCGCKVCPVCDVHVPLNEHGFVGPSLPKR